MEAPQISEVLVFKPKDNLRVAEFSLDTAFPGADINKIRKLPEYKQYFPKDEREIDEIRSYAGAADNPRPHDNTVANNENNFAL